jgi:hypothetical protein
MTLARTSKRTTITMKQGHHPDNEYINFNPYDPEQNGINEYDRNTDEWNRSNQVQEMRARRSAAINNTPAYYTGDRIHHIRSIQMHHYDLWNQLFGNELLNPSLMAYAQASLDAVNDQTNTLRFAGQMEVSLLMQENFRPGVHLACFVVCMTPHRQFRDGHLIQIEFGEGSRTHQTVSQMFELNNYDSRAIVRQATEYQILEYLAEDDDAMELLHSCFLQPDFAPMRFAYVEPVLLPQNDNDDDDYGYYVQNQNADNRHRWHDFADVHDGHEDAPPLPAAAIPPPPPINNFADIYMEQLRRDGGDDANYNIIPYYDDDEDDDEEMEAQG